MHGEIRLGETCMRGEFPTGTPWPDPAPGAPCPLAWALSPPLQSLLRTLESPARRPLSCCCLARRGTLPAWDPPQQDSPGSPAHLHCALPTTSLHAVGKPQPPVCKANRTYAQGLRIRTWTSLGVGRGVCLPRGGGLAEFISGPPPLGRIRVRDGGW